MPIYLIEKSKQLKKEESFPSALNSDRDNHPLKAFTSKWLIPIGCKQNIDSQFRKMASQSIKRSDQTTGANLKQSCTTNFQVIADDFNFGVFFWVQAAIWYAFFIATLAFNSQLNPAFRCLQSFLVWTSVHCTIVCSSVLFRQKRFHSLQ